MTQPVAENRAMVMGLVILVQGGLVLVALFLGSAMEQPPLEHFSFDGRAALVGVAATIPLLIVFLPLLYWPIGPFKRVRAFTLEVLCPMFASCTVPDLLGVALLAGFGEEMLFRGVLQAAMSQEEGPWVGLVAASMLFGLMHAVTPTYAVLAALMGAYLGWLWLVTGNLIAPIVVHTLYDFAVLAYLLAGPGRSLWEKDVIQEESSDDSAVAES